MAKRKRKAKGKKKARAKPEIQEEIRPTAPEAPKVEAKPQEVPKEVEEAEVVKKKIEIWKAKMEDDQKKKENAARMAKVKRPPEA